LLLRLFSFKLGFDECAFNNLNEKRFCSLGGGKEVIPSVFLP